MMADLPEWLTVSSAAAYCDVSRRTIYSWMATGKVRIKVVPSGLRRVCRDDLLTEQAVSRMRRIGITQSPTPSPSVSESRS